MAIRYDVKRMLKTMLCSNIMLFRDPLNPAPFGFFPLLTYPTVIPAAELDQQSFVVGDLRSCSRFPSALLAGLIPIGLRVNMVNYVEVLVPFHRVGEGFGEDIGFHVLTFTVVENHGLIFTLGLLMQP